MRRASVSFVVALSLAVVSAGETLKSLAALRDGGTWGDATVAALAGFILFFSLAVLLRIMAALSRVQRRRLRREGQPNAGNESYRVRSREV